MEERVGLMEGSTTFVQLLGLYLFSHRSFFISQFRDQYSDQLRHVAVRVFQQGLAGGRSGLPGLLLIVLSPLHECVVSTLPCHPSPTPWPPPLFFFLFPMLNMYLLWAGKQVASSSYLDLFWVSKYCFRLQ